MSEVDERIVRLAFENAGFEAGATKAIGILEKLSTALNFKDTSAGLENVKNAIHNFSMDSISNSVDAASKGFSKMEQISIGALRRIGDEVMGLGLKLLNSLRNNLTKGARDGFNEYQLQMKSLQTISANSGESMEVIKQNLNDLNEYADKTIYNFSEMTANIGRFTAAGLGVEESTNAIKGFANMAALAGAGSAETSRGMYQLSQAMAAGVVKLQDWKSIQYASIDTAAFKDILIETARAMDMPVDAAIKKNGDFTQSLKEGWLTADVMSQALKVATMSTRDFADEENGMEERLKQLVEMGYTEDVAKKLVEIANAADDSAREIRTWQQLIETTEEAIGSGWAQTWEIIVGDFDEATQLFTTIGKRFEEIVSASTNARNGMLTEWKEAGGRDALIGIFANMFEAIIRIVTPIKDAFGEIFGMGGDRLARFTENVALFTQSLVISEDTMKSINETFADAFQILHSVLGVIINVARFFVSGFNGSAVSSFAKSFLTPIKNGLKTLADFATALHAVSDNLSEFYKQYLERLNREKSSTLFDRLVLAFIAFGDAIKRVGASFSRVLMPIFKSIGDLFTSLFSGKYADGAIKIVLVIVNIATRIVSLIATAFDRLVYEGSLAFKTIGRIVKTALSGSLFKNIASIFGSIYSMVLRASYVFDYFFKAVFGLFRTILVAISPVRFAIRFVLDTLSGMAATIFSILSSVYSRVCFVVEQALDIFYRINKPIRRIFKEIYDIVGSFFIAVRDTILGSSLFKAISSAFGKIRDIFFGLVEKITSPFGNLEHSIAWYFIHPVKKLKDLLVSFGGDDRVKFFKDMFKEISDNVGGPFEFAIGIAKTALSGLYDFIIGPLSEAFSMLTGWLSGLDMGGVVSKFMSNFGIGDLFGSVELPSFLSDGIGFLSDKFKELTGNVDDTKTSIKKFRKEAGKKTTIKKNGLASFVDTVSSTYQKIKKYFIDLKNSGKSFKDIVATIFDDMYKTIRSWVSKIAGSDNGILSLLAKGVNGIFDGIENLPNLIQGFFGDTKAAVDDGVKKVSKSGENLKKNSENFWMNLLGKIPSVSDIAKTIGTFFSNIRKSFSDSVASLFSNTGDVDTTTLKASISDAFDLSGITIKLPDISNPFKDVIDGISKILDKVPIDKLTTVFGDKPNSGLLYTWFGNIGKVGLIFSGSKWLKSLADLNKGLAGESNGLEEMFKNLPGSVTEGIKGLAKSFGEGFGGQFKAGMDSLSTGMKEFGKAMDPLGRKTLSKSFLNIATGILLIAGALFILSKIPEDTLERVSILMLEIAGAALVFIGVMAGINKWAGSANLSGIGIALAGLGIGMLALVGALWLFSKIAQDNNFVVAQKNFQNLMILLAACIAGIGLFSGLAGNSGMAGAALTIVAFTTAITLAIVPLLILKFIPNEWYTEGIWKMTALAAILVAGVGILGWTSRNGLGLAAASLTLLTLVAAITLALIPIKLLEKFNKTLFYDALKKFLFLGAALLIGVTAIAGIGKLAGFGMIAAMAGLYALVGAITLALVPLTLISVLSTKFDLRKAEGTMALLGVILLLGAAGIAAIGTFLPGVLSGVAALAALVVAVGLFTAILIVLSGVALVNAEGFKMAVASIAAFALSMALLGAVSFAAAGPILVLAVSLGIISASLLVLVSAIQAFSDLKWSSLTSKWNEFYNGLSDSGKNAIDGFIGGFLSMIEFVGKLAQFIFDALVGGLNALLEIASPSKVMEETGDNAIQGFINGIAGKLGLVDENGQFTVDALTSKFNDLPDKLGAFATEAINNFINSIDTEKIKQSATDLIEKFTGPLDDEANVEKLRQSGINLVSGFIAGVGEDLANKLRQKAYEVFLGWTDPIKEFFGIASPSTYMRDTIGKNILQGLIDGLSDGTLLASIGNIASTVGSAVTKGIGSFGTGLKDTVDAGFGILGNLIGGYSGSVGDKAGSVGDSAVKGFGSVVPGVITAGISASTGFATSLGSQSGQIKSKSKEIKDGTVNPLKELKSLMRTRAKDGVNAFVSALAKGASSARSATRALMNGARSGLGSLRGSFYQVGYDAGIGFANGINSTGGHVYRVAYQLGVTAIRAAKRATKENSPSKVFHEIGYFVGEGFILGMKSEIPKTYKMGTKLAETVPTAFEDTLGALSLSIDDLLETDYNPVITPVINSTEFDSGMYRLSSAINGRLSDISVGNLNYTGELSSQLSDYNDINRRAIDLMASNTLDYNLLGVAVANALINAGVHVEMDGGQLMGYLAGEISDARRMYGTR